MFAAENLRASCLRILTSGALAAKLAPLGAHAFTAEQRARLPVRVRRPARDATSTMHAGAAPLPRPDALASAQARGVALARFAHHELQAVELFAAALLRWPALPDGLTRALARVLEDEQRHAGLYLARLAALGLRFEEFAPHSDYFWKHEAALLDGEPAAFFAAMGLTLEQANLDFSGIYRDAFAAAGDAESADACAQVHADEIRHVALAARALRELGVPGAGDTQRFEACVPFPFSAARAKGRRFDAEARRAAGLDAKFVAHVRHARSPQEAPRSPHPELTLLANFGAEEGAAPERARAAPQARALATLWRALWDEPAAFAWLPRAGVVAWFNDPQAEAAAREAGRALFGAPANVVRAVHDKAFAWRTAREAGLVPDVLREVVRVLEPEQLRAPDAARAIEAELAAWPAWARRSFVLKPRLGTSARGRASGRSILDASGRSILDASGRSILDATGRSVRDGGGVEALGSGGELGEARWHGALGRLAERGGALLEPWLARSWDASVQLFVDARGAVEVLGSLTQDVTPAGAPRGHRGRIDAEGRVGSGLPGDAQLRAAALRIAGAAAAAGYRGPCGVDAFAFQHPESGDEVVRAVVELNARFTLGCVAIAFARRAFERAGGGRPMQFAFSLAGDEAGAGGQRVELPARRSSLRIWRELES